MPETKKDITFTLTFAEAVAVDECLRAVNWPGKHLELGASIVKKVESAINPPVPGE